MSEKIKKPDRQQLFKQLSIRRFLQNTHMRTAADRLRETCGASKENISDPNYENRQNTPRKGQTGYAAKPLSYSFESLIVHFRTSFDLMGLFYHGKKEFATEKTQLFESAPVL
ncbi:MAG: hypothetical protein ACI4XQ_05960 [Eubacteriales bacterium]